MLSAPRVGLRPTTPHIAAGILTEPRVSVPSAQIAVPEATAAAEPPEEPPAVRSASQGFWVCGVRTPKANSWVCVLPSSSAPCRPASATHWASWPGRRPASTAEPASVGRSAVSIMSLTAYGTP